MNFDTLSLMNLRQDTHQQTEISYLALRGIRYHIWPIRQTFVGDFQRALIERLLIDGCGFS